MLKRLLSIFLILTVMITPFSVVTFAQEDEASLNAQSATETIITRHADGTTTTRTVSALPIAGENAGFLPGYEPDSTRAIVIPEVPDDAYGRVRVSPPDKRIGYIHIGFNTDSESGADDFFGGTAFLIGKDLLLTCAHCVWNYEYSNYEDGGWAASITFYAGMHDSTTWSATANMVSMSIPQDYVDSFNEEEDEDEYQYDWAIIRIDANLENICGWFGIQSCTSEQLNSSIEIIGYPGDKSYGTQWKSTGTINSIFENKIYYNAYTISGVSGAPVIKNDCVYGVHSFRTTGANSAWVESGGVRMYDGFMAVISQALEDSNERWNN